MNSETKQCQNCKNQFTIEPDDFMFYERMQVPPPTWCPECRFARRLIWRNERNLYRRKCDLCSKNMLSVYEKEVKFPVYCPECWRSDGWDPISLGTDYDFSKPFFEQYRSLMSKVPRPSLNHNGVNINCDFANVVQDTKNVYFSFSIIQNSEDIYYSNNVNRSRQVFDSFNSIESEMIYGSIGSVKNYRSRWLFWSSACVDCSLMLDCTGCSNCFGCVGLKNRQYSIFNQQYPKDEYEKKIASFNIGSRKGYAAASAEFRKLAACFPRRYARVTNSVGSSGDELLNCKNVVKSFNTYNSEDSKYLFRCPYDKQSMDCCHMGNAEFVYEHALGGSDPGQELRFIAFGSPGQHHVTYGDYCGSSSYLFGCIGVRNKQYCLFNKQYTKEQWNELIPKIKKHMDEMPYTDKKGNIYKYGEFFPPEFSPFAYNESVMQEHVPVSKEKAEELGFQWKERGTRNYKTTMEAVDIPDNVNETADSIVNEIISCRNGGNKDWCTGAFRIIPEELSFYRRMEIYIPEFCPNCRYYERLAQRNPLKLWHRSCQCSGQKSENGVYQNTVKHQHGEGKCSNEFETSYAPERNEIVYCEQCYQAEVV